MSCNEVKYFISTEFIESRPTRRYILYISQLTTMRVQPSPPPARFALYSLYLADISLAIVCSWMLDVPS